MKTNTSSSAPQSTIPISIHGKTLILFFLFLPITSSIPNKPLSSLPLRIPTPRTPNISTRQRTRLVQIHFLLLLLLLLLIIIRPLFSSKTTTQRNSFPLHTLHTKFSILPLVVVMVRTRRRRRRVRQRKIHPSNPFARNDFHISN